MNRLGFLVLAVVTIALGLWSRREGWPDFVYQYVGDVLYATMAYFLCGFLLGSGVAAAKRTKLALAFCFAIELSQLWQDQPLTWLRSFQLGRLVLGQGFLWSDLACYAAGCLVGLATERLILGSPCQRTERNNQASESKGGN